MLKLFIGIFLIARLAVAFELSDKQMQFQYVPTEGGGMTCLHERIRDLPDWKIKCGTKEFAAHLVIREYQKNLAPQTGLEIMYWITDRNTPQPTFSSGTQWVNLKSKTNLHSLVLTQSVENDYAYIQVTWAP